MKLDRIAKAEPVDAGFRRLLLRFGIVFVAAAACFALLLEQDVLTVRMFLRQDAPALVLAGIALLLIATLKLPPMRLPEGWRSFVPLAVFAFAVSASGWWIVFGGYAYSRDELLADFDADILKQGLLIGPVPPEWRSMATALMPLHMLNVPAEAGWLSGYLPVNAALRAAMDLVAGRQWTSPLLGTIALFAIYTAARRLWPDRAAAAIVPALLLALSPQFLVTAMTPFAMTAHLAFNLLWLCFFLRDDRKGDFGALATGFFATGLHQLVFHPLFVLPFLLELMLARRWSRLALLAAGYALIGLFWALYWQLALPAGAAGQGEAAGANPGGLAVLAERVSALLGVITISSVPLMILNLLRLAAWQHLLLLPLAFLAWPAIRRGEGIARPLALGILLMLVSAALLMPWQGVGWGYRYLHGLLGSLCLLAGYGWLRLGAQQPPSARHQPALVLGSLVTGALLLPLHLHTTNRVTEPFREASALIESAPQRIVLVDPSGMEFGQELARNAPDLRNRPIIVDLGSLDGQQIRRLCSQGGIGLFDDRHGRALGISPGLPEIPQRRLLRSLGCGTPLAIR